MKLVAVVAFALGCWTAPPRASVVPPPAAPSPELTIEVTPGTLGARAIGDMPEITVELVNRSKTRIFRIPRPSHRSHLGFDAPLRYVYEQMRPDGTWEPMPPSSLMGCGSMFEEPVVEIVLRPGDRFPLEAPVLAFPEDRLGRMRAKLIYDVDGELGRVPHMAYFDYVGTLTSNLLEIDHRPHPLELELEVIGRVVVGRPLDVTKIFRVTLRNRHTRDLEIRGPGGITAALGFDLDTPNGGVWPKGDRPVMELAPPDPAPTRTLRPGESVELFGPRPTFTPPTATWTYPAPETFRMRAMFSQPGRPHIHYSNWVTVTSVAR